jgi:uncharacterized membrane protein YeaQ/YmgE (transglycosylase-associated protein family)
MGAFLWWMIIGLVAGLLARAIVPGRQPMGIILTMILGMVGSLVGGFLSSMIWNHDPTAPTVHASGLFMSTIGAILVLAIYGWSTRPRLTRS